MAGRRVAVIGAGPSGLVACKLLRDEGYLPIILEGGHAIGGTFVNKAYDKLSLVSSKYLTCFSDLRATGAEEDHMGVDAYIEYLEDYATKFGLNDLIQCVFPIRDPRHARSILRLPPPRRHSILRDRGLCLSRVPDTCAASHTSARITESSPPCSVPHDILSSPSNPVSHSLASIPTQSHHPRARTPPLLLRSNPLHSTLRPPSPVLRPPPPAPHPASDAA